MVVPGHKGEASEPVDGVALAKFRTQLALDRTMLAWIRTALSMVGFGFGTVAFFRTLREREPGTATHRFHEIAIAFGVMLLVLGVIALALAGSGHWRSLRALDRGYAPDVGRWPLSLTLACSWRSWAWCCSC